MKLNAVFLSFTGASIFFIRSSVDAALNNLDKRGRFSCVLSISTSYARKIVKNSHNEVQK